MAHERAGDVDYHVIGGGYATHRRPDPRIEAMIHAELGDARTVLNVGAGAGSYEPTDRYVIAVEPSPAMRAQRPRACVPAIDARAEALPLDDLSVDASMAVLTVHQWQGMDAGLRELRRVTRGPIVIVTLDGDALDRFWLSRYVPELMEAERRRYPSVARLSEAIGVPGRPARVTPVMVPIDCTDGFTESYYARPERFLDPAVRKAQSAWQFVNEAARDRGLAELDADLRSGRWDELFGEHRRRPAFESALRIIAGGG